MVDDIEITIASEEPPASGSNVTFRFTQGVRTGAFSLAALGDIVEQMNQALVNQALMPDLLERYGSALFDALFHGSLLDALREAFALAHAGGRRVRLRLYSERPAIVALVWEYLYDKTQQTWLALQADLSLVRALPLKTHDPATADTALRVLVMLSSPADLPPVNVERAWNELVDATGLAAIELLRIEPTYAALLAGLRQQPHVFHYVGHGMFAGARNQGFLMLADERGQQAPLAAEQLSTALGGCRSLHLAVLDACEGAVTGTRSVFGGIAQQLLQQGLPAVLAMQGRVQEAHARRFSVEFYRALADGLDMEQAVCEGRKAVAAAAPTWGMPALYFQGVQPFVAARLSDAAKVERLWQLVQQQSAQQQSAQQQSAQQQSAQQQSAQQQSIQQADENRQRAWLETILRLAPQHIAARKALEWLNNRDAAENLYSAAQANYANGQWRETHRALEQVERLSPNYRDTRSLLAEVLGRLEDSVPPAPANYADQVQQYEIILNALKDGRLVPFLGWGVCEFGRPAASHWVAGHYPPNTDEIAALLAEQLHGAVDGKPDLLSVSEVTALLEGESALYERLVNIYGVEYRPTILHSLLAELPGRLRRKGYPANSERRFILFSTAFDDLLEEAFAEVGQPFHLFAYRKQTVDAEGVARSGRFAHIAPSGECTLLETPNTYTAHDADRYPIIVKLCGRRVTADPSDTVVVTEDHFLDYMPAQEIGALLPMTLLNQVKRRSFLFLGHSLQPWHCRLLWHRLRYQNSSLHEKAWAILPEVDMVEQAFWRRQGVEPLIASTEGVVAYINNWLSKL